MKNFLYILLIGLFGYASWYVIMQGFEYSIGTIKIDIPSYAEVTKSRETLDANLTKLNSLNNVEIANATEGVKTEMKNYETRKQEYDLLAATASEEDIAEANKEEKYLLDYLWIKIGEYASDNDVKWKMSIDDVSMSVDFDINGTYVSVINFIYDLENDPELQFNIDEIIIEGSSAGQVKANFTVEDVMIVTSPTE